MMEQLVWKEAGQPHIRLKTGGSALRAPFLGIIDHRDQALTYVRF